MERLIGNIYDALEDDDALEALPEQIANEVGSRSCTLQLFSPDFELEDSWLNHFEGSMYDFYCKHNLHIYDAWTDTNLNKFGLDKTRRHTDYMPIKQFQDSFFYNEFIRHFGDDSAYCLGFISSRRDGGYVVVGLQKGISDSDFTDIQVAKHDAIRPHLSRMLVLRRNLCLRERKASSALVGIEGLEDAYLVISANRRIIFANRSAEILLKDAHLLKNRAGRLELDSDAADKQLGSSMCDVLARRASGCGAFLTTDRFGQAWRFTLAPKIVTDQTMLLVWIDRGNVSNTAPERLQKIYGLTRAEIRVLMALCEGRSAQEIADLQTLSVATIRTHIQHVYQKTGVKKATQLSKLVATLPKIA